jgi:hypothetical protein
MQENAKLESGTLSAAKLAANRANARLSCGPKTPEGKARSSRNSTKHGLTRRTSWAGECPEQNEKSFQRAWDRSGPRDAMEETCVASLLQARSRDDYLLDAERTLLTRRPVMATLEDVPYPFLYDPDALNALDQLGRQDAHFARVFEKDVAELLTLRKNKWATPKESVAGNSTPRPGNAQPGGEASCEPIGDQETADPAGSLRALEEFLGDRRVLLPGEDFGTYEALARGLWTASQPGNLLEELVVGDIIRVQWRLDRVLQIEQVFLAQSAVSATGHGRGFGFGFVHDCQRGQALERLRNYECRLRHRLGRRRALWRKLRKQGWQDAAIPTLPPTVEGSDSGPTDVTAPPATSAPTESCMESDYPLNPDSPPAPASPTPVVDSRDASPRLPDHRDEANQPDED